MNTIKRILAFVLVIAILSCSMISCGKDKYKYVEMTVKDYGTIILKIDMKNVPITSKNFIDLVESGFYNGLTFHRVIENFMIQGGDPKANGTGGSENKIKGEFSENGFNNPIKHERGVISMARGSYSMDSASSQFFICNASNYSVSSLDGKYAAFGWVVEGMDVVDAITEETGIYGDSNGTIYTKSLQAVITEMKVIDYKE